MKLTSKVRLDKASRVLLAARERGRGGGDDDDAEAEESSTNSSFKAALSSTVWAVGVSGSFGVLPSCRCFASLFDFLLNIY